MLKEKAAAWTKEYAAEKTGLAPEIVEKIADDWSNPATDAYIIAGYGMRYMNANETYRLLHVLGAVSGRFGKPRNGVVEGLALQGYPLVLNNGPVSMPDGPENVKSCGIRMADWFEIAQTDASPYKALLVCEGNPVHQQPDRQRWFMQSSFTDDPINIAMSGGEPATRLNPIDARKFGFQDGDKIEVYNDRGHVVTKLVIDESVPAGTVHVWFGWRRRQFEEGTYAEMVQQCASKDTTRPLEDKWYNDWIARGHSPNTNVEFLTVEIGSTDCYWDSWCNVRKYEAGKEA